MRKFIPQKTLYIITAIAITCNLAMVSVMRWHPHLLWATLYAVSTLAYPLTAYTVMERFWKPMSHRDAIIRLLAIAIIAQIPFIGLKATASPLAILPLAFGTEWLCEEKTPKVKLIIHGIVMAVSLFLPITHGTLMYTLVVTVLLFRKNDASIPYITMAPPVLYAITGLHPPLILFSIIGSVILAFRK